MFENESECFEAVGLDAPQGEDAARDDENARGVTEPVQAADLPEAEDGDHIEDDGAMPDTRTQRRDLPDAGAFMERVESELAEIRRYDPTIETPRDLLRLDRREAFFDAVKNHRHTFAEAYRYVYADRIAEAQARRAADRAAQHARNSDLGKRHMLRTTAAGEGAASVPAEVERNIRAIMPKATVKQIREYYQKYDRQTR